MLTGVKKEECLARPVKTEEFFADEEAASSDIFGTKADINKNDSINEVGDSPVVKDEDSNQSLAFVKPEFLEEVIFNDMLTIAKFRALVPWETWHDLSPF